MLCRVSWRSRSMLSRLAPLAPPAGALASVRTSAPAKVDERLELAEVVEQTGTPTSARRRNNAAF